MNGSIERFSDVQWCQKASAYLLPISSSDLWPAHGLSPPDVLSHPMGGRRCSASIPTVLGELQLPGLGVEKESQSPECREGWLPWLLVPLWLWEWGKNICPRKECGFSWGCPLGQERVKHPWSLVRCLLHPNGESAVREADKVTWRDDLPEFRQDEQAKTD